MNYYNYQPQGNGNDSRPNSNSRNLGNSFILRNSGQNILGSKNYMQNSQSDLHVPQQYDNNPMAKSNFLTHHSRQQDFNSKQLNYNNNIINQTNDIRSREQNLREIDRLNKINSEILRKQYANQMNDVKNAQVNLKKTTKPEGNPQREFERSFNNNPNQNNQSLQNGRNSRQMSPAQDPPKRFLRSSGQEQELQNNNYQNQQYQQYQQAYQPQPVAMFNPYAQRLSVPQIPQYNRFDDDEDEDDRKDFKQVGKVLEKQNDIIKELMNKLNTPQQQPQQNDQRRDFEEYERYMRLHQQMMDMKYSQSQIQQVQQPQNDQSNMMMQMMFQQQMMQAVMYSQVLRNQDRNENKQQQMSVMELMKQQKNEDNLERMIKQLIVQKGGNMEQLQQKLDDIAGRQQKAKEPEKKPVEEDDDDDDDEDDDDEDDEDEEEEDSEAKKAELEKQRKAELAKVAKRKVKAMAYRNMFAFIFLKNLRVREEERRSESLDQLPLMQKNSLKQGLLWALAACEKAFSMIRAKPKEDLDIINNVDKLKSNVLDQRISTLCNLTQFIVEGMLQSVGHMPDDIFKFAAVYFQEKAYLPDGIISQFEIDRLEFNQNFGYIVNVSNDQKQMLVGVYFLIKIIVLVVLARPWQYQLNDTKLKDDQITKTKLLQIASLIYHIFIEDVKKKLNPIQNNMTSVPIKLKTNALPQTLVHELGNKPQAENGTRYNIVTGVIDYNNLLVVWTQMRDWRNDIQAKLIKLLQSIVDKANQISDQADKYEKLDNIKQAQEDQNLLPPMVQKTKFDTQLLNNVPIEDQMHLIK